jgi:hypothetical protein
MYIARLHREACRVREAIEQVPVASCRETNAFSMFPAGSCGDTCRMLGAYLQDVCGFPVFQYVCGERGSQSDNSWTTHAWLQRDTLIVDVTADQFSDAPRPIIIVEENSSWHQQFETKVLGPANLKVPDVYDLRRLYDRIKRSLGAGVTE